MRKTLVVLVFALAVTAGCAESGALRKAGVNTRADVFQEVKEPGGVPQGSADLHVYFSLKTHNPGIFSSDDLHGTPEFGLLLNVDGQALRLQGSLLPENVEPGALRDPEAGDGTRYRFTRSVRMKGGNHKVIIAIPADELAVEREITLAEGSSNNLVLEPLYRGTPVMKGQPASYSETSFKEGIRGFRVLLNGKEI